MALATDTTAAHKFPNRSAASLALSFVSVWLAVQGWSVRGDGCFVFHWNEEVDIKEPTQKAIVFYDGGREDLLLQVKYEGPLEEFGWVVPVPGLPTVTKGAMEPFYELSKLMQRQFGTGEEGTRGRALGPDSAGSAEERVKVVETKTVGAYEVAVLAAKDAGSLEQWLRAHDYSFPEGKFSVVEEYIRRGWYFVAAKIELNKGLGFKTVSATSPNDPAKKSRAQRALRSKLSSGELHPLLISFDTAKPVFPLKITGVAGKSSEISLYLVAAEPLVEGVIFGQVVDRSAKRYAKWRAEATQRASQREQIRQTSRGFALRFFLDSFYTTNRPPVIPPELRDYTQDDLLALAQEEQPTMAEQHLGEIFWAEPGEALECLQVSTKELAACARTFFRMKTGQWFVTKQVQVFAPEEMRDLEFEPALGALSRTLTQPWGSIAARTLGGLGPKAHADLIKASSSTNDIERLNAAIGMETSGQPDFREQVGRLLQDRSPAVRYHALNAIHFSPDQQILDTLAGLLRDPELEIRQEASGYLSQHERAERTGYYLELTRDPVPEVRFAAIGIAAWINRYKTSDAVFQAALRLLKDRDEKVRYAALSALYRMHDRDVPREDIVPFLSSPSSDVSAMAHAMLRPGPPGPWDGHPTLSTEESARLLTNRVATARLAGLKNLQQAGDIAAVELILPLLSDTNKLVRNRTGYVLRNLTGASIPENDPAKWRAWWDANQAAVRKKTTTDEPKHG